MVPGEVNAYLWRGGFHLLFPMRGKDHWRVVGILPEELRERADVSFDAVVPSLRERGGREFDPSRDAAGFPPIGSRIDARRIFARAAAFCWAMPRIFTAQPVLRA